ncbi:hypothetical protein D9757_004578 [Collybiopsis confluens]|uniref:Protein kinase domain-containing protein n=1 Tax=Collybiopsis confluens TaxID=2823264 RepID=A0A8H5HS46_9AGAR|nr:hypothetical protein D9757_004578 [Collybiopsis confluens]
MASTSISLYRHSQSISKRPSRTLYPRDPADVCAKLTTVDNGRNAYLNWAKSGAVVPLTRLRIPLFPACIVASLLRPIQDISKNGVILNGRRIKNASVILMDGDSLRIPDSLTFKCTHYWKSKEQASVFDPKHPVQKNVGRFILTSQCLGSGSFATVHLAWAMGEKGWHHVACKSIKRKKESDLKQVMKEVRILMKLQHPNINRIYTTEENSSNFIHIFLELCTGGDLFTYINSYAEQNRRMGEDEAKYIMYQLLKGLEYLHRKMISHRDLKPENILLHAPGAYPRIEIADFGLARPKSWQETFNVCGTVSYLPPEGILALDQKHLKYVGMPSDCWSAGIILYIMLSNALIGILRGSHPFDNEARPQSYSGDWLSHIDEGSQLSQAQPLVQIISGSELRLKERIVVGEVNFDWPHWHCLSKAKDLITSLLLRDASERATVFTALQSLWIKVDLDALRGAYQSRIVAPLSSEDRQCYSFALELL